MNTRTQLFRPELYATYLKVLARIQVRAAGPLQNKVSASDIAQQALMQAFVALPQFKGTTDKEFAAWLRRILANKLTDAARHFGRLKRDLGLEDSYCETLGASSDRLHKLIAADQTSPSEHVMRSERLRHIAEALSALPWTSKQPSSYITWPACL